MKLTSRHGWIAAALPFASAAVVLAAEPLRPTDVEQTAAWDGVSNLASVERFWFSSSPDKDALEAARAAGVDVVIDLRTPGERNWDEGAAAEELGMEYRSVPIAGAEPFSTDTFTRVDQVVAEFPDETILVHCASGNRAGAWFATHLVRERGMSVDEAVAVGQAAGLTKAPLAEKVRAHLSNDAE